MVSKVILLLVGAALLIQDIDAERMKPATYKDKDSAMNALIRRLELYHLAETELSPVYKDVLTNGKTIMEKVLNDPKVLDIKTERMTSILKNMRKIIAEYDRLEKEGIAYGPEMGRVFDTYDSITGEGGLIDKASTQEDKAIAKSFMDNNFVRYDRSNDARVKDYTEKFQTELQKIIDGLPDNEKTDDRELLEVLEKLKTEKDIERRDDLIWRLLGMSVLDRFMW